MTARPWVRRRDLIQAGVASILGLAGCTGNREFEDEPGDPKNELSSETEPPASGTEGTGDPNNETAQPTEYAQAAVSISDSEVVLTALENGAGVYCGDAAVETPDDIEPGENGATTVGESFPCDGDVYGITESGTTTRIA